MIAAILKLIRLCVASMDITACKPQRSRSERRGPQFFCSLPNKTVSGPVFVPAWIFLLDPLFLLPDLQQTYPSNGRTRIALNLALPSLQT
jgi:hypothetical protein